MSHETLEQLHAYTLGLIGGMSGFFSFDWVHNLLQIDLGQEVIYQTFKFFFGLISAIIFAVAGRIAQTEYDKYKQNKKRKNK